MSKGWTQGRWVGGFGIAIAMSPHRVSPHFTSILAHCRTHRAWNDVRPSGTPASTSIIKVTADRGENLKFVAGNVSTVGRNPSRFINVLRASTVRFEGTGAHRVISPRFTSDGDRRQTYSI